MIVAYDATTNACANCEIHKIVMTFAHTILPLSQTCHVRIIIEKYWHTEMFCKIGSYREILPLRNIRRSKNRASMRIERTRGGDADGGDIVPPHRLDSFHKSIKNTRFVP